MPLYWSTIETDAAIVEELGFLTRVKSEFKKQADDEKFENVVSPPYSVNARRSSAFANDGRAIRSALNSLASPVFAFKNGLLRDVIYGMMFYSQRRALHLHLIRLVAVKLGKKLRANREFAETIAAAKAQQAIATAAAEKAAAVSAAAAAAAAAAAGNNSARKNSGDGGTPVIGHGTLLTVNTATATTGAGAAQIVNAPTSAGSPAAASGHNFHLAVGGSPYAFYQKSARSPGGGVVSMDPQALAAAADLFDIDPDLVKEIENELKAEGFDEALLLLEEADLEAAATAVNGGLSDGLNATVLLELEADAEEEETENLHGILQSLKRHRRLAKIGERPDDDDDEQHNQKQNGRSRHSSQSRQYSRNAVKPSTLLRPVNEGGNSGDKNSSNGITGASTGNGIDRSMNTNPSPNKPGATGTKGGVTGTPAKLFVTQKTTRGNRPLPRSNSRGVDQLEADTLSGRGGNGANASAPSVRRKGSTDAEGGADGQTGSDNSDEHTCCLCCMGLCLSADEPIVKYQQQPSGTNGRRQISATHSHNMAVAAAAAHRKEGGTTGANVGGFSAIPNPNTTNAAGGGRHHHLQPNQPPNASPNRPGGGAGEGTLRSSTATGNGTTVTAANIKLSSFNDSNGEHKTGSHHTNSGTDSPGGGDVKASLLPHKNMSGSGHQHLTPTTNVLIVNDSTASGSGSAGGGLGGGVHGSGGAIVLNGARASSSVSVAVHQHRSGIPFAPRKSSIRSAEAAALLVTSVAGNNNPTNANHLHNISLRQPNPMIDPSHSPGGGGGRATDVEVLASLIADGHAHVAFDEKGRKMGGDPFGLGTGNFGASNLRRPPRLTQSDMDVMRAIVGRKASTAVITPPAAVPSHPPVLHPSQSMPLVSPHTPATSPPAAAGGPAAVPVAMIRSASTTTPSTAAGIAALTSPSAAGAATNNAVSPGATMTPAPTPAHNNKQPPIQSPSPSAAALLDPKARAISEAMRRVGDWEFDIFALSDASTMHPLVYIGYAVFHHFELPKAFRIPERTLFNFLSGMEFGYNWQQNPFHSSVHIADVLHTVYVLMRKMSFTLTNELDLLSLCVAAIVHDYRHPGFTNQFFVASMENRPKDVSLTDPRVLENFHCTGAFKFLREEKNNIFVNMSAVERREVRQKIVQLVLATSMDRQSEFLAEVERDAVVHKGYIPGGVLPLSPLAPSTAPALSGGGASPGVSGMISPGGLMVLPEASPSPAAPVVSSASAFSTPIKPPQFGDAKDKPSPTSLPAAGAGAGAEPEEKSIYETAMAILAAKKAAAAETGGDATVVTGAAALTRSKRSGRKSARDSAPPAVATANVTPTKPFAAPAPVTPAGPPPGLLSAGSTKRSTTSTAQLMKSISSDANPAAAPAPEAPLSTTHANSSHSGGARDSVVPDSKLEDRSPSHSPPSVHSNLPSEFRAVGEGGDSDNEGIAKPGEGTMTEPATATVDGVATAVVILPPSGQSSPKNNFRSIASEDETSESTHHLRPGGLNPNSSQNEDSFGGLQRTVSMDTSMVRHSKELKTLLNSRRQKSQDDDTMGTVAIAAASGLPPPRTSLTAAAASDSTTSGSAPPLSSGVGMLPLDEDKQLTPGRDVISPGMNTRSIRDAVQPARGEAGAPPRHSFGTSHRLPAPITIPNENTLMRTSAYQPPSPNSAPVFGGGVAGPNTASILLARGDSTNSAAADATPSSVGPLHVPGLNGFGTDSTLGNGPPRGSVSHLAQRRGSERSAAQAAADAAASLAAANALMGGKGSGVAGSNRHATNLKRRTMERLIQEGVQAQQKKKAQPSITIMPRKSVDGGQPGSATGNGPSHAHHTHHGSESKTFAGVVGANQTPTAAMMLNMSGPHHPHAHRVPRDSMAVKKKLLLKLVLKCADVSAAAKPFHLYKPWAHAQHTELLKQGDIERSRIAMATVAAAAANGGASSSWVAVNSVPSTLVGAATATTAAAGSSPNSTATNSNKLVLSKYMDRQHPQVSELRTELHLHTITHLVRPLFDTLGRVLSAAGPSSDGAELAARTKAHLSENVALLQQRALEIRKNSDLTGAAFGASNTVTVAAPGSGPGNKSTPAKMTLNSTQPLSPTPSPQRVTSGTPPK